jgi:hypothetical protein
MIRNLKQQWKQITPHGQSLVELALFFPMILMMLSGLVEFGFVLNQYLNLMDGPREAARFGVDLSPFLDPTEDDDILFYSNLDPVRPGVAEIVQQAIVPYVLDPAVDDVIISVVSIKDGAIFHRYPDDVAVTSIPGQFSLYGNKVSKLTDAQIVNKLIGAAPKVGAVVVEMYYNYHQVLALPWITIVVPDPILLHMVAVAPLPAATPPDATPIP